MLDFKIFIASTLKIVEYRDAIKQLCKKVNSANVDSRYIFSTYDYVENELQTYCHEGAQRRIDERIKDSTFFVLIIDGVVKPKSVHEFLEARSRLTMGKYPAYIIVLQKINSTVTLQSKDELTYEEFERRHLNSAECDEDGKLIFEERIYSFPFETTTDIVNKIELELK